MGPEKLTTYEAMRAEIATCVTDKARKLVKHRAAALKQSAHAHGDGSGEMEFDNMDADQLWKVILETASEEVNLNQSAVVKNLKVKKGKGKGKQSGLRKCSKCNSEEHIARDCLVRAARVAGAPAEGRRCFYGRPWRQATWQGREVGRQGS